jgi:hypothetical protein
MKRPSWAGESESACRATVSSSVSATSAKESSSQSTVDVARRRLKIGKYAPPLLSCFAERFMGRVAMRCNANLGSLQGVGPLPLSALTTTPTATCLLSAKLSANQPAQWQTRAIVHTLQTPHTAAFPGRGSALTRKRSLVQIQYRPPVTSLVRGHFSTEPSTSAQICARGRVEQTVGPCGLTTQLGPDLRPNRSRA